MTTEEKFIKNKRGLLQLTSYLKNVSKACCVMGYSRDTFYRVRKTYEEGGIETLEEKSRRVPNVRNRVAEHIENAVDEFAYENRAFGQKKTIDTLNQRRIFIYPPLAFVLYGSDIGFIQILQFIIDPFSFKPES